MQPKTGLVTTSTFSPLGVKVRWATQKTSSNMFLENKRKLCHVR
jgi:hypothetical protein